VLKIAPDIDWGFALVKGIPFKEKVLFWANCFLGRPYISNPLSEGEPSPRIRFDGFDCMTYVETILSLAISEKSGLVLPNLDKIRYKNGEVSFHTRNHFVCADWLENNSWLVNVADDFTDDKVTRTIDRARFFSDKGNPNNSPIYLPTQISLDYKRKENFSGEIPDNLIPSVALFVGNEDWIIVAHMGLIFKENGKTILYHASSKAGEVVKIAFSEYLASRPSLIGFSLLRIEPVVV